MTIHAEIEAVLQSWRFDQVKPSAFWQR